MQVMPHDLSTFPRLTAQDYTVTSVETDEYNCIAWAAEDDSQWWEPVHIGGYFWPSDVPFVWSLPVLIRIFENLGYEVCIDGGHEEGFEKVALYANNSGEPTHGARQVAPGRWTSKLGEWIDIEHGGVECLGGDHGPYGYGEPTVFMRRAAP